MALPESQAATPTEEHTPMEEQKSHIIDGRGDVVLVVGYDTKLRVSSSVLANASEPFANLLLSPNFKEGKQKQDHVSEGTQEPLEVELPEDEPSGMLLLCQLLHHRGPTSVSKLSREELVSIAVLANKYLIRRQFRYMLGEAIIIPAPCQSDHNALFDYHVISYLLESSKLFMTASDYLVRTVKLDDNLLEDYGDSEVWKMMPDKLLGLIQAHALRSRTRSYSRIWRLQHDLESSSCKSNGMFPSEYDRRRTLEDILRQWDFNGDSINALLKSLPPYSFESDETVASYKNTLRSKVTQEAKGMRNLSLGLCFWCIKDSKTKLFTECSTHND